MLNINEIFCSIDGEVNAFGQGRRTVFIRLQGCSLQRNPCKYCDTKDSISNETKHLLTNDEILNIVKEYQCDKVTITGGEPLLQYDKLLDLVCDLKKKQYKISVETNGSINVDPLLFSLVDSWIVDCKLNMKKYAFKFPIHLMRTTDWIKFPIEDEDDFRDSLYFIGHFQETNINFNVAWSAIYPKMTNTQLLDFMIKHKVNGCLNVQLHKLLEVK